MNATDQIRHKIQSDPVFKKHAIYFVHLNGKVERRISTGIMDDGKRVPGVLSWRDENGVFHVTAINNYLEIYFDEIHRDMVEATFEEIQKKCLEAEAGENHGG